MNALKTSLSNSQKPILILSLLASLIVITINCSDNDTVGGVLPPLDLPHEYPPEEEPPVPVPEEPSVYVWGSHFHAANGAYQDLVESCRRCGLKRVHPGGSFGAYYERTHPLSSGHIRDCRNYSSGYIQIEFAENKLPTEATVTIQPKYQHNSDIKWGAPFAVTSTAVPINKDRGFQIILSPNQGLGGNKSLIVESISSSHINKQNLEVTVFYGGGSIVSSSGSSSNVYDTAIIIQTLRKNEKQPIPKEKVKYSCLQYTN